MDDRDNAGFRSLNEADYDRPASGATHLTGGLRSVVNRGSLFSARISGTLVAPETGAYRFWIAGDDDARFRLQTTDGEPLENIASVKGWTFIQQWDKYDTQRSAVIHLQEGESYAFEVLHREGAGVDHVEVAWSRPSDRNANDHWDTTPREIVPEGVLGSPESTEDSTLTPDAFEFNDTLESAASLDNLPGNQLTANTAHNPGQETDYDWYSIHLNAGERLSATATSAATIAFLDVAYTQDNQADPVHADLGRGTLAHLVVTAEKTGDYRFAVGKVGSSQDQANIYDLAWDITPAPDETSTTSQESVSPNEDAPKYTFWEDADFSLDEREDNFRDLRDTDYARPASESTLLSDGLRSVANRGDRFSAEITGSITAPETGTYRFWVSGDDDADFRLQTTTNDLDAPHRIASVRGWTRPEQWGKYPSQRSNPVFLEAGETYSFEVRHREGGGSDHVAVGWSKPSDLAQNNIWKRQPREVVPQRALGEEA